MICLSLFQTIQQNSQYDNIIQRQNKRGKRISTVNNLLAVLVFPVWDIIQEKAALRNKLGMRSAVLNLF